MSRNDHLIGVSELATQIGANTVRVVDASWHLPTTGRDAKAEYRTAHIPGAVFFDIDAIADHETSLPHMMPTPAAFATAMGSLGLTQDDDIVIYDSLGLMSAARVWFMLRAMGATKVRVLDGGLPAWIREGQPTESGEIAPEARSFDARPDSHLFASIEDVADALNDPGIAVVDARSEGRFAGSVPEPRPGLRSGHMPGARNLPFDCLTDADGYVLDDRALRAALAEAGIADNADVITSCGSGVTAAVISLALAVLGRSSRVYDGSWAEWGAADEMPIDTGPAR